MNDLPKSDLQKQPILSRIAGNFKKDREYSEFELNDILKGLKIGDISLIRRELVNFKYLGKDSIKGIYWLKKLRLSEEDLKKIEDNQKRMQEMK